MYVKDRKSKTDRVVSDGGDCFFFSSFKCMNHLCIKEHPFT